MYNIQIEKFNGPLELLLDLIEEKKLSINEIALAEVSEQYFSYVKNLKDFPKSEVASFLVVAATLMLIKSKSLLPGFQLDEKEAEDVRELEMRIHMLKIFRKLSRGLGEFVLSGKSSYFREKMAGFGGGFYPPKNATASFFAEMMLVLIEKIPAVEDLPRKTIEQIITIEQKMAELINRITEKAAQTLRGFISSGDREELIVTFLAMLELLKQGLLAAKQDTDFGDITIAKS